MYPAVIRYAFSVAITFLLIGNITCSPLFLHRISSLLPKRDGPPMCQQYIIIQARGTNEPQGPSAGFALMNALVMGSWSGGNEYFVQYPANWNQISVEGTDDIINKVMTITQSTSDHCIILQGYSQGAAATTNALNQLNGTAAETVKGVFLIGNPLRKPNLSCNVNSTGGNSTAASLGIEMKLLTNLSGIPDSFVNKTLDVCIDGDGICDSTNGDGYGDKGQHLSYAYDANVQSLGFLYLSSILSKGTYDRAITI